MTKITAARIALLVTSVVLAASTTQYDGRIVLALALCALTYWLEPVIGWTQQLLGGDPATESE